MNEQTLIKLLQSGNFTIAYHDNQCCSLYKGKHKYEDLPENSVYEFDDLGQSGYTPMVVEKLVKALGGKVDSI